MGGHTNNDDSNLVIGGMIPHPETEIGRASSTDSSRYSAFQKVRSGFWNEMRVKT